MKILKFGGTSVGSPERIRQVINIILETRKTNPAMVIVVSAFGGVTNQLIELGEKASVGDNQYLGLLTSLREKHERFAKALIKTENADVLAHVAHEMAQLQDVLNGVFLVRELSAKTLDYIMSFGERLSAFIISSSLLADGHPGKFIDMRNALQTNANFGSARPDFDQTNLNVNKIIDPRGTIPIATGFIGTTERGETTTLGRGGSDYTAAIIGAAVNADIVEIWTDVDGVMTADPRKVSKAFSIKSMSYEEAMEMSHFGAKVIHPPTVQPLLANQIPISIRNTFNPAFRGTLIKKNGIETLESPAEKSGSHFRLTSGPPPIKGISSIPSVALVKVQGSGMIGVSGTARRLFDCLGKEGINIILITQASSEHSICIAIEPTAANKAREAIEGEFQLEIQAGLLEHPTVEVDLAIVAVVGEYMRHTPGISGKFFDALGRNGINVVAIAQGSSELNISTVISNADEAKALNAIHDMFFHSTSRSLNLFLVGSGLIGSTLLKQINEQSANLKRDRSLELRLIGLANSREMVFNVDGIDPASWQQEMKENGTSTNFPQFVEHMQTLNLPNSVFIDCTASDDIIEGYASILDSSISIVTPNKKANAGSYEQYRELQRIAHKRGIKFLYETNVGAGLPVISTLRDLVDSGDRIIRIEGILSGTLSYIFNSVDDQTSFSKVVLDAREKGLTEPDPREDLNGMDVARKLLILARQCGHTLELTDITVESLVPAGLEELASVDEFLAALPNHDANFEQQRTAAAAKGNQLRYIARLENGSATVAIETIDDSHPFANTEGTDNKIVFTTERYLNRPLVIRGPGAGAEVTAAGVFADLIRISY